MIMYTIMARKLGARNHYLELGNKFQNLQPQTKAPKAGK